MYGTSVGCHKKGEVIFCRECDAEIAKLKRTVKKGDRLDDPVFEWYQQPFRLFDGNPICRKCFSTGRVVRWLEDGQIFDVRSLKNHDNQ